MSFSRSHLSENQVPVHFDPTQLSVVSKENLPEVDFCLLMGSSVDGTVAVGSDIDLAFYLREKLTFRFYSKTMEVIRGFLPDVCADIGILNSAEPVYRFEALKGKQLFVRDMEVYVSFYSRTCREYESQMFDYERQRRYRREACHAV